MLLSVKIVPNVVFGCFPIVPKHFLGNSHAACIFLIIVD